MLVQMAVHARDVFARRNFAEQHLLGVGVLLAREALLERRIEDIPEVAPDVDAAPEHLPVPVDLRRQPHVLAWHDEIAPMFFPELGITRRAESAFATDQL